MSRATMLLSVLAAMLMLSLACRAQSPTVIAEELYDQWDQSYANHDLDQVLSFLDPSSYTLIDAKGKRLSFVQYRQSMLDLFTLSKFRSLNTSTEVRDVQEQAGRLVVYYKNEFHYEYHDQRQGWVPMIDTSTGLETWERKGSRWKVVMTRTLRDDLKVDPEWQAARLKELDAERSMLMPCNYSYNGCR